MIFKPPMLYLGDLNKTHSTPMHSSNKRLSVQDKLNKATEIHKSRNKFSFYKS